MMMNGSMTGCSGCSCVLNLLCKLSQGAFLMTLIRMMWVWRKRSWRQPIPIVRVK